MRQSLIDRLSVITEEEKQYLGGQSDVENALYFGKGTRIVTDRKLFPEEAEKKKIEIRTHARFVDFPLHGHDFVEMMYVCRGHITHIVEGREIVLPKGGVLLMNRHVTHAVKRAEADDIGVNFIISSSFFESVVSEIRESNVFTDFLIENLRNNGKPVMLQFYVGGVLPIENLMETLLYSIINGKCTESHVLQKTMSLMLTYFVSFENILVSKFQTDDYCEKLKNAIENYIRTDYREASLTALAAKLGMSHTYLCKWISMNMDVNFKDMVVEQRFKIAEYLLKTTNLSVSDIASAVGYENASYFYRQFRKRYGQTPRTVRTNESC